MRNLRTFFFLFFAIVGSLASSFGQEVIFQPLAKDETLEYAIRGDPKDKEKHELIVWAIGSQKREVFRYSGLGFGIEPHNQDIYKKWLTIAVISKANPQKIELWMLSGKDGIARLLPSPDIFSYAVDNRLSTICFFNTSEYHRTKIPSFFLYQLPDMKFIKKIEVLDIREKGLSPITFLFKDGKYYIELAAELFVIKKFEILIP